MRLVQLRSRRDDRVRPAERLFCAKPFESIEVQATPRRGATYLCCPSWLPVVIGNVEDEPVAELWNGELARAVRRSILDGSFAYCTDHCPFLQTKSGPVKRLEDVDDPEYRAIIEQGTEVLARGPRTVNASFDKSCNLACPTCRTERIIESHARDQILAIQDTLNAQAFGDARTLYITGSGDAFGSPYGLAWLRRLEVERYPELRLHLHTNAQLWAPQIWAKIPAAVRARVRTTEISIDAASAATYALNRVRGRWDRLLDNLGFIAELRRAGPLEHVRIHMVVQENNFHEMPAFVELGRRFGFDTVYFSHLVDWGTFAHDELARRSVHEPHHPRHAELREVLRDPRLADPIAVLGNLTDLARAPAPAPSPSLGRGLAGAADGTCCWADLYVDDLAAAQAFYGALFGWTFVDEPTAASWRYSIALLDGRVAAAIYQRSPEIRLQASIAWSVYATVADCDAAAGRVAAHGGRTKTVRPPRGVELLRGDVGALTPLVLDPAGGALWLWTEAMRVGPAVRDEPGALSWVELVTTGDDTTAARAFYAAVMGWTADEVAADRDVSAEYARLVPAGAAPAAARASLRRVSPRLWPREPGAPAHAYWLALFGVADCDASARRAAELGGKVIIQPHDVPGVGRIAHVIDPQGATLGLIARA